jgi:hypothetical protein
MEPCPRWKTFFAHGQRNAEHRSCAPRCRGIGLGGIDSIDGRSIRRHTAVGYAIHHAMSIFWATFYEAASGRVRRSRARVSTPQILGEATAMTAIAFFVDYVVTPRRFRPGFRKHIGRGALVANYAAFALGLALTSVVRRGRKRE